MSDDQVKMCKRLSKYAHAQLSSVDLERIANRIEELEAALATARQDAANIARSFSCCHVPEEIAAIISQEQEPKT